MPREMKDSGIEWIGEIPSTWKLCKIKHVCSTIGSGTTPKSGNLEFYENGTINWIQSGDLYNKATLTNVSTLITKHAFSSTTSLKLYIAPYIVIAMYGASVGNTAISTIDACTNQACCCLKPNISTHLKYLFYWINHCKSDFLDKAEGGTQPNISQKKIANQYFLQPSFSEQQLIANFLDYKRNEIDALHADIEKQIATLEEYKKSIITEAVTKGLNPDAEMKIPSIFYLGPINRKWSITRIGYICTKLARSFTSTQPPLVCSNNGTVKLRDENATGIMVSDDHTMQGIHVGDIAIHGMDTWHGAIAFSKLKGKITRVVHVCESTQDNRFIVYWLQHLAFQGVYKLISSGVRGNTSDFRSWDKVSDIYIPLPPLKEQQEIADYLDQKTTEIDAIISAKKQQLDILDNYKKSLIYEYVTGKKEVPSYANAE